MQPEVARLKEALDAAERIAIAAHISPDGDTIGAALALGHALEEAGRQVCMLCSDPVPMNLRFLPGSNRISDACEWDRPDLAIIVDMNTPKRLGRVGEYIERAPVIAVIDHHQPSEEMEVGLGVIRAEAAATCLILFDIMPDLGLNITPVVAQCLLAGIATDTGSFRFRNTDPKALEAAGHLLALGADITQINEEVWDKKPLSAVRLLARALNNLELTAGDRIAYSSLSRSDFDISGALDEDAEGIVNEVGRVRTAQVSVLFREARDGRIKVSVRSRGTIDVSKVCRIFGGGGHVNAAGCIFTLTMNEARAALLPELEQCLESS